MERLPNPLQILRRQVFYIPGYDPIHPRRYRELYRKEGAAQAAISGYDFSMQANETARGHAWNVQSQGAQSAVEILVWSDIVQVSMRHSIVGTYAKLVRTAWAYIGSGALWRLMFLPKGPVLTALYPIGFLLAQLALALGVGAIFAVLAWRVHPALALVGLAPIYPILAWFRARDKRFLAYYLMHDYAYSARYGGANPPELAPRIAEFVAKVQAALRADVDEVLIVGHSSGAHLAVHVLADVLRAGLPPGHPPLSFLSLGHVVPMVSFLPKANALRRDLAFLAAARDLTWVDVTAPGDVCCFALCDPVAVSGVSPPDKLWPLVISAAFSQSLSLQKQKALKGKWFRLHIQYLCAFDRPKDYDYFAITAGPMTLGARFAERAPSKSRMTRAVNRFTAT